MGRVVHRSKGYQELLGSPGMVATVLAHAEATARSCGEGYDAQAEPAPRKRARAVVIAVTAKARRDNSANNTILKNLR